MDDVGAYFFEVVLRSAADRDGTPLAEYAAGSADVEIGRVLGRDGAA
jgi:hypothetical protein